VHYHYAPPGHTSGLAIASMVLGILWIYWLGSILAVIFGHIAISQASKDPTLRGKGMAIAGLVLGYIGIGTLAIVVLVAVAASSSS
jgi:hypothetical protein